MEIYSKKRIIKHDWVEKHNKKINKIKTWCSYNKVGRLWALGVGK